MPPLFPSIDQFLITFLIILVSQIIYSSTGFGAGMFAITFFGLLFGNLSVFIPLFILITFQTEIVICFRHRKDFSIKKHFYYLVSAIPFIILGAYLLKTVHQTWHFLFLGMLICSLSLYFLFFENKSRLRIKNKFWQIPFGMAHGLLGSLYGMAGPPLVAYLKGLCLKKTEFRNTSISIFFMMSIFRLPVFVSMKLITWDTVVAWFFLMPAGVVGVFLGLKLHHRMSEEKFKRIVSVILFFMGLGLILKKFML